jgi:methionine-rich copper-binding protein CopC
MRILIFAICAVGLIATCAGAHPTLTSATPAAGVSAASSPTELRLTFSEDVVPRFSRVTLKDQGGKTIATGPATTEPKDKKQLVVLLKAPLTAGSYTVEWHAVSEDTHAVKGQYSFKVGP